MKNIVVDIADFAIAADPKAVLSTHALGSCIGVAIWDADVHVGGLLHFMLPEASLSPESGADNPGMFADTGVPALFKAAYQHGAEKRRLIVKIAGGAQLLGDSGEFNIGKQNYLSLRRIFWKNDVVVVGEHVGGQVSRSMELQVATGRVTVRTRDGETIL